MGIWQEWSGSVIKVLSDIIKFVQFFFWKVGKDDNEIKAIADTNNTVAADIERNGYGRL